jgi:hypothetical protein
MSIKTERPQVRTAQDLERKYADLFKEIPNIKRTEVGLFNVNNILSEFITATIGDLQTLQNQLDGEIDTWYGNEAPTLLNEPASNWQVSEYNNHIGDLYYDQSTGNTYQFIENEGIYSWEQIESSLMSEILSMANAAKDTADNKRRVFVNKPTPPYDRGDLWLNNQELYICQIAKASGSYTSGDFIVATKYTDDTTALSAQQTAELAEQKALDVEATTNSLKLNFDRRILLNDSTVVDDKYSTIAFEDGSIIISAGDSIVKLKIENDRIGMYFNGLLISSWIQDEFTARQINLGNFAFIPRENGSLGFRKVR